jgi:ketosteroid isomerase-like protein
VKPLMNAVVLSIALQVSGCGQNEVEETTYDQVATELESVLREAILNRDTETLERIWADDFMVNNPGNQVIRGKDEVIARVHSGVIHYESFEQKIENMMIRKGMIIVMGQETILPTGIAPGAGNIIYRRYTNIWMKEGDTWLLTARHANIIPRD